MFLIFPIRLASVEIHEFWAAYGWLCDLCASFLEQCASNCLNLVKFARELTIVGTTRSALATFVVRADADKR